MTVNFAATGSNTNLGGSASTDPKIRFSGVGQPFTGTGTLLANSSGGGTIGWATVNGNSFATLISAARGIGAISFTSLTTAATLASQAASSVIDFAPTSTQTLSSATNIQAAIRISPNGGTSLSCGTNNLSTSAIMLDGTTDYSITATTGINNSATTK